MCIRDRVELDSRLDERTHDGMPAEAIVDVPTQIALTLHHVCVLDEHHRTVEAVVAYAHAGVSQSSEAQQARVVAQRPQRG